MIDDDLPVLTQVLRTGNGRLPRAFRELTEEPVSGERRTESTVPGALVIGSEPDRSVHTGHDEVRRLFGSGDDDHAAFDAADPALAFDVAPPDRTRLDAIADPRRIDLQDNDVFLRTAPTDRVFATALDEPPLLDALGQRFRPATGEAPAHEADPFEHRSPAASDTGPAFARQVRDAVLQDLAARIDTELDARIAETLRGEVETALAHLQNRLRIELNEALRDVVGRAVDDAVRRLQASPIEGA